MVTGTKDYKASRAIRPYLSGGNALSRRAETKQQSSAKPTGSYLLRTVPHDEGFHFFTDLGKYTGLTATNTVEFAEQLQKIPIQSVIFHFERHDFQTWLREIIGDEELAEKIE